MNKTFKINLLLGLFIISFWLVGCKTSAEYGEKITISPDLPKVQVKDILGSEQYLEKMVVLEGKITLECGSGCWFNLEDNTGKIYVDILPSNFAIPQWVGKSVVVKGRVTKFDGDTKLIGQGVALK